MCCAEGKRNVSIGVIVVAVLGSVVVLSGAFAVVKFVNKRRQRDVAAMAKAAGASVPKGNKVEPMPTTTAVVPTAAV